MRIEGSHQRTIWVDADGHTVRIIDQTLLPHELKVVELHDLEAAAVAIESMQVRGAPLIGATAAYGVALAMGADPSDEGLERAHARLIRTRPTAVNLRWALDRMVLALRNRTAGAPRRLGLRRGAARSATRTWRSAGRSARTASSWCAVPLPGSDRASPSTS